jgi:hypothetical protein
MRQRGSRITRRQFIQRGAAAAFAAPLIVPRSVWGGEERTAPSERLTVGFIGCGKMANGWLDRQRRDPWQLPQV